MKAEKGRSGTLTLGLVSIFSTMYVVASLVPISPVIGVAGAMFRMEWVTVPLSGVVVGPIYGPIAVLMGVLLETTITGRGLILGPVSLILPSLASLQTGLFSYGRWRTSSMILLILIIGWLLLPTGRRAWPVTAFYVLGLSLILIIRNVKRGRNSGRGFITWTAVSYCGNITRHILGNIFLVLLGYVDEEIFIAAMPFTVIEQTLFAIFSAILITSTLPLVEKIMPNRKEMTLDE
ncbi:MAG: hypothetical protein GTN80_01380 [Nitrososphaeria archaeon]|nr:hypothetical protein [Nitrososphaeria archaeon]NIQ32294.1 hypothetical protein [Nitrososphaeria archaeon]